MAPWAESIGDRFLSEATDDNRKETELASREEEPIPQSISSP
jgi:hypothetical protein